MLKDILQAIVRRRSPVIVGDTVRMTPASSIFGLDRGQPLDRYYIERFLAEQAGAVRGNVLEIGSDIYTERFGGDAVLQRYLLCADGYGGNGHVLPGNLTDPDSLPEGMIDCFICTQTFNFIYDVQKAVAGSYRLLKPGGTLLATVAGISQISRYDMERWGDYWRFTTASLHSLFKPVFGGSVQIASHGNLPMTLAFLQGISVEDLPDRALLDMIDPDYQMLLTIVACKEK